MFLSPSVCLSASPVCVNAVLPLLCLCVLSFFQVSMVERRLCGSVSTCLATPEAAQCPPGSVLFTYVLQFIYICIRVIKICFYTFLLNFSVYMTSIAHLSRGIPTLFLPYLSSLKSFLGVDFSLNLMFKGRGCHMLYSCKALEKS